MPETSSLSDDLQRLEEIVRRLEDDSLDLDAALALFEEGLRRLQSAQTRLSAAETRVRQVLESAGGEEGSLRLESLDG
jgi:exodeoxyribonuclease VII small subunit